MSASTKAASRLDRAVAAGAFLHANRESKCLAMKGKLLHDHLACDRCPEQRENRASDIKDFR